MTFERSISMVEELRLELHEEKIRLSQLRDGTLTEAELIAKLQVFEEFRR